jgi:hypothetical protein
MAICRLSSAANVRDRMVLAMEVVAHHDDLQIGGRLAASRPLKTGLFRPQSSKKG